MSRWPVVAVVVMACNGGSHDRGRHDDRELPGGPAAAAPASVSASAPASAWWTGSAVVATTIAATVVPAADAANSSGDDTVRIVRAAGGVWRERVHSLVDATGREIVVGSADVIASDDALYLFTGGDDDLASMRRIDHGNIVPLTSPGFAWAFDFGGHVVAVGNTKIDAARHNHYRTIAVTAQGGAVVDNATTEYATDAARVGDEVVIAAREHDSAGVSDMERANAIMKSINGDSSNMAATVGTPHGVLAHVDATAHELRRELFTAQLPSSVAATSTGWLVVATEGTPKHGYRDAVVVQRSIVFGTTFQLLAEGIDSGPRLVAAGAWVCFLESDGERATAHCVDPARRLHVRTETLAGILTIFDIEPGAKPRVVLHHTSYSADFKTQHDETLAFVLP